MAPFWRIPALFTANYLSVLRFIAIAPMVLTAVCLAGDPANTVPTDSAPSLSSYKAIYRSEIRGMVVDIHRQLERLQDGQYQLESKAEKLVYGYSETSRFSTVDSQLLPNAYHYRGTGFNRREIRIDFNRAEGVATSLYKDKHYSLPLADTTQDKLSWQESIRLQLLANTRPDSKQLAKLELLDGRRQKNYSIEFLGHEQIQTPLGNFRALHMVRKGIKQGSDLDFWLAEDWQYLLLKARQNDKKEGVVTVELIAATLNQTTVSGD
ncbi:MAG: hypothetical protein ACI9GW_001723 [Halieaceae bacterium]|jgi:hypothetical protein